MYDINTKNVRKGKNIFYFLLGFALFFIVVFGLAFISTTTKSDSLNSETLSTGVDVKSYVNDEGTVMYKGVYYYEVDGINYICSSNVSTSSHPGTENKKVYYDSSNPSSCMVEHSSMIDYVMLIGLLVPMIFVIFALVNIRNINKRVKAINDLNKNGKLIKQLPYRLENTGTVVNGVPIKRLVIDYTLSSGVTIPLYGDPRNDRKFSDADGMVDLLIDENNPSNYFIDFEINRLTGNLPQDYSSYSQRFNQVNQTIQQQQNQYFDQAQFQQSNQNINN